MGAFAPMPGAWPTTARIACQHLRAGVQNSAIPEVVVCALPHIAGIAAPSSEGCQGDASEEGRYSTLSIQVCVSALKAGGDWVGYMDSQQLYCKRNSCPITSRVFMSIISPGATPKLRMSGRMKAAVFASCPRQRGPQAINPLILPHRRVRYLTRCNWVF